MTFVDASSTENVKIRKVDMKGTMSTVVGVGNLKEDGPPASVNLYSSYCIGINHLNHHELFIWDIYCRVISHVCTGDDFVRSLTFLHIPSP